MSLSVDGQLGFLKDDHLPPYLPFPDTDFGFFTTYWQMGGREYIK